MSSSVITCFSRKCHISSVRKSISSWEKQLASLTPLKVGGSCTQTGASNQASALCPFTPSQRSTTPRKIREGARSRVSSGPEKNDVCLCGSNSTRWLCACSITSRKSHWSWNCTSDILTDVLTVREQADSHQNELERGNWVCKTSARKQTTSLLRSSIRVGKVPPNTFLTGKTQRKPQEPWRWDPCPRNSHRCH